MGLYDDSEAIRKIGVWDERPDHDLRARIGFAKGQIAEAMGCIEGADQENGALYWCYKALVRAKDMLETGQCS